MTDFGHKPRLRKLSDSVAESRKALSLVRPFLDRFEDWNHRAARHTAMLVSSVTDPDQKAQAGSHLAALRDEVEDQFAEFLKIASASRHNRVEDVRHAFRRLLDTLDGTLGRVQK